MSRVLIGIPCLLVGGTEIQTLRLVQALASGHHEVALACYFEYDRQMVSLFETCGCKVYLLSKDGIRPTSTKSQATRLLKGLHDVVRQFCPTIAHVQYMAPGAMPIILLRLLGVKTIIATLHTDADIYEKLGLIRFLSRRFVKVFTCVTQVAERNFFGDNVPISVAVSQKRNGHCTVYNCLPPDFPVEQKAEITFDRRIGVVSRLELIKGADLILPAFKKIKQQYPDATLRIVGDGKLRQEMEQQQRDLAIPKESVIWVGRVPQESLPYEYSMMDLVWIPSRSEGFGLTAIEAMSHGKAIVASAVGGLNEIIAQGKNGILTPKEDSNALAESTAKLFNSPDVIRSISEQAINRAKDFSFLEYRNQILSIYSALQ